MSRQRVLHIVTALGIGGVEVWLLALLEELKRRADSGQETEEFDILMTGGYRSELDVHATALGATLHYIAFSRTKYPTFARKFRQLLSDRRYTAIHDHQDYSGAWHLLAGIGRLPPTRIIHVHNPAICLRLNTETPVRKGLFRISKKTVRRLATHILGTSAHALREYGFEQAQFPDQAIRAVHCGIDVAPFARSPADANESVCHEFGWPRGSKICIFVGRLEGFNPTNPDWNHKNPAFALDVVTAAIRSGTDMRFLVVGDGDRMRATLELQVEAAGLSDQVRFPGRRFDVARLMCASHACLFPSLEEGLGMVAVEAQAAGLHVLASDTVPHEAVVLPALVTFMPLNAGTALWAAELSRLMKLSRFDNRAAACAVSESEFSIKTSYARLHDIYAEPHAVVDAGR